jgi:uncharacterized protein YpmS
MEEKHYSGFWPLLTLNLAFLIILVWQLVLIGAEKKNLQAQLEGRKTLVEQSKNAQSDLEKLVRDLLELSQKDPQAKAIVDKYKIAVTAPAAESK